MRIVSLKQTSPGRVAVCLEDGSEIRSTPGAVTELRLFAGRELDEAGIAALRTESARSLAREKALECLSRRQMSRRELCAKLREKGFDEETADGCADWVAQRGLLDEESYAAAIVRHYSAKGYGAARLRQELQKRGIPRELAEAALEALSPDPGKLDRLVAARLRDPGDRGEVRRLSAALFRRGFSSEEIRAALARMRAADDYED